MPSTAWHAEFADVNNDSFVDLFVTKGNVEGMIDFAKEDPNNLLMGTPGPARSSEGAPEAGIATSPRHRGAAVADLNLDGLLDLVVVNRDAPAELWRNLGASVEPPVRPMGNWIEVCLSQPGGNRNGVGAWVEVRSGSPIWRREVTFGGGHASGQAGSPISVSAPPSGSRCASRARSARGDRGSAPSPTSSSGSSAARKPCATGCRPTTLCIPLNPLPLGPLGQGEGNFTPPRRRRWRRVLGWRRRALAEDDHAEDLVLGDVLDAGRCRPPGRSSSR